MRFPICAIACLCLLPSITIAQTSTGFEDPTDISNIIEYRLADWGWFTWDLDGEFTGEGSHSYRDDTYSHESYDRAQNAAQLASSTRYHRENENLLLAARLFLSGSLDNSRYGHGPEVNRRENINGLYDIYGRAQQYLGRSSWFATGTLGSRGAYNESLQSESDHEDDWEETVLEKSGSHSAGAGLGFGRIRDVTPLIRAARLSERLAALGRPNLSDSQIQEVAQVLAQEYGYRVVFDRPDRRFWSEVLDPMIQGEPLTVAEVFYLTDVLQENLGSRRQGYELSVQGTYRRLGGGDDANDDTYARCFASVFHNLSLESQVYGSFSTQWSWWDGNEGNDIDRQYTNLGLGFLWNVADRILLDGSLTGNRAQYEYKLTGNSFTEYQVRAELTFDFFIEDRLSLRPAVGASWQERDSDREDGTSYSRRQDWHYALSINYRLEGLLF